MSTGRNCIVLTLGQEFDFEVYVLVFPGRERAASLCSDGTALGGF